MGVSQKGRHKFICNEHRIDYDLFGRFLFLKLEAYYFQSRMDIQTFGAKAYEMWNKLPNPIRETEPFWTLCYADDPLSWGDENQTRALYEKAFRFYNII